MNVIVTKDNVVQIVNELVSKKKADYYTDCSTTEGQIRAYKLCNFVQAMISRHAGSLSNLKIWALDAKGKEVTTPEAKRIIELFDRPNKQEDFVEFFSKLESNCKLHGKAYVHRRVTKANGVENFVIPNKYVSIDYDTTTDALFNRKIKQFLVTDNTQVKPYKPDEINIISDGLLQFNGYENYGASRLEALSEVISTYITLWEIRTELLADHGAKNIISMQAKDDGTLVSPFLKEEKDDLYSKLKQRFGLRRGQDKNIISKSAINVSPLSAKIIDMQLVETIKDCKKEICASFGVQPELEGVESSRFKTVPEARKEFYTQTVIPRTKYLISKWLKIHNVKPVGFTIEPDYSHMDFYQEDLLKEAVAFQQMSGAVVPLVSNGLMSIGEARIKLDLE